MKRSVRTVVLAATAGAVVVSVLVGVPAASAAKKIEPGSPCTADEVGKQVLTKGSKAKGVFLICEPDEEGYDHVNDSGKGSNGSDPKMTYQWVTVVTPTAVKPDKDFVSIPNLASSLADKPLVDIINAPYSLEDAAPCKLNGVPASEVSESYGDPGLWGRSSEHLPSTWGTLTVGVVFSVSTGYTLNPAASSAYKNGSGGTIVYINRMKTDFMASPAPYVQNYFLEQSYGRLNVNFKYYPKIIQGNQPQSVITSDPQSRKPMVQFGLNVHNQIPDEYWENEWKDVDLVWNAIQDKAGNAFLGGFRDASGNVVNAETPLWRRSRAIYTRTSGSVNTATHELGHALRFPDLYQRGTTNKIATRMTGRVGKMSGTAVASGVLGWNRYINRWLTDANVECLDNSDVRDIDQRGSSSITLHALQDSTVEAKQKRLAVIPFSAERAVVAESWKPLGTDANNGIDGVVVYVVNAGNADGLEASVPASSRPWWQSVEAPVALYRSPSHLWTLEANPKPQELVGCRKGQTAKCKDLMVDVVRDQGILKKVGDQAEFDWTGLNAEGLCTELAEPETNPFSPTFTQGDTRTYPRLTVTLADIGSDHHVVDVDVQCRNTEGLLAD